jgi:RHS repeat-associated protein
MKTMTNWSDFGSGAGARVTTWKYDGYRGWLTNKTYDTSAPGPGYSYTPAGRLQTRVWARGITTTYGYNAAGDLTAMSYSDTTPGLTNGFDRLGRKTSVTNGVTVCTFLLDDADDLLSETYSGGPLNGLTVTNLYDSFSRRSTNGIWNGSSWLTQTRYGYDAASRLHSVGDGTNSATYVYVANSPLVSQILFTNSGTLRMTTTKQFDYLNRLTSIQSVTGSSTVASFSYGNNSANQRTSVTNADSSYWVYQYDSLGQVKSGKKYWSDNTPVAGQQLEYTFDDIGNRTQTKAGGDGAGSNLRTANYTNNTLNQITGRDVPGYVNILGEVTNTASIYVNGQVPYRKANYFREELNVDNSSSALWQGVTNFASISNSASADLAATNIGSVFVPKTAEVFSYDADGNLTNDGRWSYSWDAENRLTNMTSQSTAPTGSKLKLDFTYDYLGRRVQKTVATYNGSSYIPAYTNKFAYDGWNLIALLNPSLSISNSFTWGLDLSGSIQGAGGVGGLLWVGAGATGVHFCAFDGNGNVETLVNSANGDIVATYAYGPFGEALRATGVMAKINCFRFSTKYQDDETDLLYYGYRYFKAAEGVWLDRDPIEEQGGVNLYSFGFNDSINGIDTDGRDTVSLVYRIEAYFHGPPKPGNPYVYGAQGLFGAAPNVSLGQYDQWTFDMRRSHIVEMDRQRMRSALTLFCKSADKSVTAGLYPGDDVRVLLGNELGEIPKLKYLFVQFPSELFYSNPTAAFVGSWTSGYMQASKIDCCGRKASIHFHGVNVSGLESASHLPPDSKSKTYGPSLFGNDPFGADGPMHSFSQTFDWDEDITF